MSGDDIPKVLLDNLKYRFGHAKLTMDLSLSISLLNLDRSDLLADVDGSVPIYNSLADEHIIDAYDRYLSILIDEFSPKYVVTAMEVNELYHHDEEKWQQYKILASELRKRLKIKYPSILFSESITLHNLYNSNRSDAELYTEEIFTYVKTLDFVSISYYPFLQGLKNVSDMEKAFDFLHERVDLPIAFVETNQIADQLIIDSFNVDFDADECVQNEYLELLFSQAQRQDYLFVIWWAHRDYDELWDIFPDEVKELGKLWLDTGLLDEAGKEKIAFQTWQHVLRVN